MQTRATMKGAPGRPALLHTGPPRIAYGVPHLAYGAAAGLRMLCTRAHKQCRMPPAHYGRSGTWASNEGGG
eukprot:11327397-Alexandrium_andersonii.AAC.1